MVNDYTGRLLYLAHEKAHGCALGALPPGYGPKDVTVLMVIAGHGPLAQHALAGILDVNRTVMVHLIDDLESRGLVRRDRNPDDRRSYALSLTANGRRVLRRLTTALDRGERHLIEALSPPQHEQLRASLRRLLPDPDHPRPPELADRVGYLLAKSHLHLRALAESRLADSNLQMRHFSVLELLSRLQPCSQQDLARTLDVSAPVVLEAVEPMEAKGFVERTRSRTDRRAYELRLTDAGAAWLDVCWSGVNEVQDFVEDRLGGQGAAELNDLLRLVVGGAAASATYPRTRVSSPQRVDGDE